MTLYQRMIFGALKKATDEFFGVVRYWLSKLEDGESTGGHLEDDYAFGRQMDALGQALLHADQHLALDLARNAVKQYSQFLKNTKKNAPSSPHGSAVAHVPDAFAPKRAMAVYQVTPGCPKCGSVCAWIYPHVPGDPLLLDPVQCSAHACGWYGWSPRATVVR